LSVGMLSAAARAMPARVSTAPTHTTQSRSFACGFKLSPLALFVGADSRFFSL
jgi:hypothetical protein